MKTIFVFLALSVGNFLFSQITFKGCTPLFEDQFFTLNNSGTDSYGKKIYITTPVTGDQPCGGLGTCEFTIQWNNSAGRWEFTADSGNGDFVAPYLIYYSTSGNGAATNPPNISIGGWVENTAITNSACGGNLTVTNSSMTGDVHTSVLAVTQDGPSNLQIYPNPVTDYISVSGASNIDVINIFSADGKLISGTKNSNRVNVSKLSSGLYFIEIITENGNSKKFKFIKK